MFLASLLCFLQIKTSEEKGGFKIKYYEEVIDGDIKRVSKIAFIDQAGNEVFFSPRDPGSLGVHGYFKEVLSPDKEYAVLPQGRFDGYCILSCLDVVKNIQDSVYKQCVTISELNIEESNVRRCFYHTFGEWKNAYEFSFSAGLSNTEYQFTYNIETDVVFSKEKLVSKLNLFWIDKDGAIRNIKYCP